MPKKTLTMADVSPSEKTAPSPNSKNVIVSSRPTIKDTTIKSDDLDKTPSSLNHKINIQPISIINNQPPEVDPQENSKVEKVDQELTDKNIEQKPLNNYKYEKIDIAQSIGTNINQANQDKKKIDEMIALNNKQDEMIDSKTYFLPINSVRNKKNKKFVILGAVLIVILMFIWLDVSLDAGIFHLAGIKPVTHFFQQHP